MGQAQRYGLGRSELVLLVLLLVAAPVAAAQYDAQFTGGTLRFDYYHSGTATEEHVSLDAIRAEGDWPGSRTRLLDDTNLGKYLFEVIDRETNLPIYSRGFASIFGEWQTIDEARSGAWRTFHESQRFPEPRAPVQLVLKKRGADGAFRELFTTVVDPGSRFVERSDPSTAGRVWTVVENGPPAVKVDLLVLGDGYTATEMETFHSDVRHLVQVLFSVPPFAGHRNDFNVRAIDVPAARSGVTDPRAEVWRRSPLGLSYNAFDSERYILTYANRRLREIAAGAPYDALILLANNDKYGGGGIFNLWTTAAAHSGQFDYLVVHEFGHSFAGLADEYYTSEVSYEEFNPPGVEPWEPNITALLDPERLKWEHLLTEGTPIPTPWNQEAYDEVMAAFQKRRQELRAARVSEEKMDAFFREVKETIEPMLQAERYYGVVGAFEGGGYRADGIYRPQVDCIMFTRNPRRFCAVCAAAIERVIRLYAE